MKDITMQITIQANGLTKTLVLPNGEVTWSMVRHDEGGLVSTRKTREIVADLESKLGWTTKECEELLWTFDDDDMYSIIGEIGEMNGIL